MLEILFLVFLCKKMGATMRAKGRSAGWCQAMLVCMWFVGEVAGVVVGFAAMGSAVEDNTLMLIPFALAGAGAGAGVAFLIAKSIGPVMVPQGFPVCPMPQHGGPMSVPQAMPMQYAAQHPMMAPAPRYQQA